MAESGDTGLRLQERQVQHFGAGHRAHAGDRHAIDLGILGKGILRALLDPRIVDHAGEIEVHGRTGFLGGIDHRIRMGGDIDRVVGMIVVTVAQQDGLGVEVLEIVDHQRGAPALDLEPGQEAVHHDHPALNGPGKGRGREPGKDHLVIGQGAGLGVDVLGTENMLPCRDHLCGVYIGPPRRRRWCWPEGPLSKGVWS